MYTLNQLANVPNNLALLNYGSFKTVYNVNDETVFGRVVLDAPSALSTAEYTAFIIDIGHAKGVYKYTGNVFVYLMEKFYVDVWYDVREIRLNWVKICRGKPPTEIFTREFPELITVFQLVRETLIRPFADIKAENIGHTSDGRIVLFDCFYDLGARRYGELKND